MHPHTQRNLHRDLAGWKQTAFLLKSGRNIKFTCGIEGKQRQASSHAENLYMLSSQICDQKKEGGKTSQNTVGVHS